MATITSPGLRLSPFCTASREGSAAAIQRSCLGLVKTPILGFSALDVVVCVDDIFLAEHLTVDDRYLVKATNQSRNQKFGGLEMVAICTAPRSVPCCLIRRLVNMPRH